MALSPIEQANTGDVVGREVGRAEDRLVLVDVGDDLVDLARRVAEAAQRPRASSG